MFHAKNGLSKKTWLAKWKNGSIVRQNDDYHELSSCVGNPDKILLRCEQSSKGVMHITTNTIRASQDRYQRDLGLSDVAIKIQNLAVKLNGRHLYFLPFPLTKMARQSNDKKVVNTIEYKSTMLLRTVKLKMLRNLGYLRHWSW